MSMLKNCRVLDLTTERGFLCGQILGDLGADVIKVEPPGGSPSRNLPPFFGNEAGAERSLYWWAYNRNKRGMTIDVDHAEGRAVFERLVAKADIVLESFDPGFLAEKKLGYAELSQINPAIVCVSITPFGQTGPKASYADSDLIIMAAGGVLILSGDEDRPPIRMSVPQAYLHASVDAAAAALVAYYERLDSGMGQHVDVAAQESVTLAAQSTTLAATVGADETRRMAGGAKLGPLRVPLVWNAKDGQITSVFLFGSALGPFTRKFVDYLYANGACEKWMQETDWIAFGDKLLSGKIPITEYDRAIATVAEFFRTRTKVELFELARQNNFLIAPVATIEDVLEYPHFAAREYWQEVKAAEFGAVLSYPGPFARFSATPISFRRRPPRVGEHNRDILEGELGMTPNDIEALSRKGVI